MQGKRVLVAGCGKIGLRVARNLAQDFEVWGLRRSTMGEEQGLHFIAADLSEKKPLTEALSEQLNTGVDYLIYCLTPSERDEASYRQTYLNGLQNILETIPKPSRLERIFFVSSSSVYHQDDSSWVDEQSLCQPNQFSGQIILEAEKFLQESAYASSVIRFTGIYGGSRRHLIKQVQKSAEQHSPILSSASQLSNRIHEDDCVGFLAHLLRQANQGNKLENLYLATDSCPVELNEVIEWLAHYLDIKIPTNTSSNKTAGIKRRGGNKKCRNTQMLKSGYVLRFPSYRQGYQAMLEMPNEESP